MPTFAPAITDYWRTSFLSGTILYRDENLTVAVNPNLPRNSRVMVLEPAGGGVMAVLTPGLADRLDFDAQRDLSAAALHQALQTAGVTLNGPDYLFYFADGDKSRLRQEPAHDDVRRLTTRDAAAFAEFQAFASD